MDPTRCYNAFIIRLNLFCRNSPTTKVVLLYWVNITVTLWLDIYLYGWYLQHLERKLWKGSFISFATHVRNGRKQTRVEKLTFLTNLLFIGAVSPSKCLLLKMADFLTETKLDMLFLMEIFCKMFHSALQGEPLDICRDVWGHLSNIYPPHNWPDTLLWTWSTFIWGCWVYIKSDNILSLSNHVKQSEAIAIPNQVT